MTTREIKNYQSNPFLKAANQEMEFTEEQVREWIKCAKNPIYFAEKYCRVESIDEVSAKFKLYPFQKDIIKSYVNNRYVIVKCSRQVGKTVTTGAFVLWSVIFQANYKVLLLGNNLESAMTIM